MKESENVFTRPCVLLDETLWEFSVHCEVLKCVFFVFQGETCREIRSTLTLPSHSSCSFD